MYMIYNMLNSLSSFLAMDRIKGKLVNHNMDQAAI